MGQGQRTPRLRLDERALKKQLELAFPRLRGSSYKITSAQTPTYNCIAWAAGESERWWEPLSPAGYWPDGAPHELTVDAYVRAYETVGFTRCADSRVEPGYEKIVLYASDSGVPKHAARQLLSGKWTSKLGKGVDIEHTLIALQGTLYGKIAVFLRRPVPVSC